jgi:hypothetical protein
MLEFWLILTVLQGGIIIFAVWPPVRKRLAALLNNPWLVKIGVPVARFGFAWMFWAACRPKIASPYSFAELVAQYQMLPSFSVNFFSLWLPMFEAILCFGLLFTRWHREITTMMAVLMVIFIIALAQTLVRDLGITCGCFDIEGAMDKSDAWNSILRDIALLPIMIWMGIKGKNKYIWQFGK